jgi:hypothetical protein
VWNTTAGGNSTPSTVGLGIGNYYTGQTPICACDNNINTVYTDFGPCTNIGNTMTCGLNTGFYWTPQRGPSLIIGLQICTAAGLPARDPITITFEGSSTVVQVVLLLIQVELPVEYHSSLRATQFGTQAIGFSLLQSVAMTHPPGTLKFN